MRSPRLMILASGGKEPGEGGSGFKNPVMANRSGVLDATIVVVVSNHERGGVYTKASELGVDFEYSPKSRTAEDYRKLVQKYKPDYVALSGWISLVEGLDPRTTFNIHPGPLPGFGGKGMHGDHVHEAVLKAFDKRIVTYTEVTMHFATPRYDEGPVFFRTQVPIENTDSVASLRTRVNAAEHKHQPRITDLVIHGRVSWDGMHPESLRLPMNYLEHLL